MKCSVQLRASEARKQFAALHCVNKKIKATFETLFIGMTKI